MYNYNKIPDIYDSDNDNDGIPTSVELQNHLDPFNSADAEADLDNDGLTNIFEYQHNLSITDKDTDHDGINDGEELKYWNETRKLDLDTSLSYCRIPDVDNDSIPDGKEIHGYEVKIITGWKSDGTPISEMRTVDSPYLDPLIPYGYNSTEGMEWSDVDDDGIPDVVENLLSNSSRFLDFYNFTHKDDWMKDYRLALWENYSWAIAYYFAIKLQRKWAVVYNNLESNPKYWIVHYNSANAHNKSCEENATNYLSSQFNPMVVENMAPVILKFNVKFYYYVLTAMVDVHTLIYDCGGVKYVKIKNSDFGQIVEWSGVENIVEIDHTFWASPWGANLGVNITVIAKDLRGNKAEITKYVYGPIGQLLQEFLKLLGPFLKLLQKFAKMIADGLNIIWNWLLNLIKSVIQTLLSPIWNAWNAWVTKMNALVEELIPSRQEAVVNENEWMREFTNLLLYSPFAMLVQALSWGIMGLEITLFAFSCVAAGVGPLSSVFAQLISVTLKTTTFTYLLGIVGSMTLGAIIGMFVPLNSSIWNLTLNTGTTLASIIGSIIAIIKSQTGMKLGDALGLFLTLTGFFWAVAISNAIGLSSQVASIIAVVISITGLLISVLTEDIPPPPIGWIDEFINAACVGINGAIAARLNLG